MKILVLSDLHLEFARFDIDTTGADAVVLAGDIHIKMNGVKWALETITDIPVVYVLGNHEYYGEKYPSLADKLKELTANSCIHILENDCVTLDGINFFGCTLWTDFRLTGDPLLSGWECGQIMTDFRRIRRLPDYRKLKPSDALKAHQRSLEWIKKALNEKRGGKNLVVTHHAPSIQSLPAHKRNDPVSAAYASDLDAVIVEHPIDAWIHGHIHTAADYKIGNCRVICNPRGYPDKPQPKFNPGFILTL